MYAAGTQVTLTAVPEHGGYLAGWTGDASGRDSVQTVAMDAARSVEAIFTRSQPLVPGEAKEVSLAASSQYRLYSGGEGCSVLVPPDATKLTVAFESSIGGAEVDLYVRRGLEVRTDDREAGTKLRIVADHEWTSQGAAERIVIERGGSPPLANDTCRIGLGVPSSEVEIRGTLTARIQRSGIAAATPRALAFVSPEGLSPPRQAVRLDRNATGSFRYRIESNRSWLAASPREWVRTQRGTTEIAVTVDSAGLSLATHQGKLAVVNVDDRDATVGGTPTGIEIPVAFAVVPAGGSADEERNEVSIASYPGNADSCGAGECIRLGATFTEPVVVSGIPTLALTMESGERLAAWTGSTRSRCGGDWTLGFRCRVRADDSAPGGIGIAPDALAPSGGSIRTAAGTEASLAVVSDPGRDAKHNVNGRRPPQVESVWIISRPRDGSACGAGEAIDIPVTFDLRVETLGTPSLLLEAGNRYRHASLHRLQWNRVQFRYIVQEEDRDPDGITLASMELFFNGGYIRSVAGTDPIGDLGHPAIGGDGSHKVDGSRASVPEVRCDDYQSSAGRRNVRRGRINRGADRLRRLGRTGRQSRAGPDGGGPHAGSCPV